MLQRIRGAAGSPRRKWNDSLLIGEPDAAGHYSFTAQADSTSDQKALAAMKDSLGLQQYATADDVMEKLVEDYKLESYPLHWQRVLGRHPLRDAAAGVLQRQQLRHGRECQRSDRGDHQGEQP